MAIVRIEGRHHTVGEERGKVSLTMEKTAQTLYQELHPHHFICAHKIKISSTPSNKEGEPSWALFVRKRRLLFVNVDAKEK
jgi:hypothetical protein